MAASSVRYRLDGFAGELLHPDDAGYDQARKLFNGMINRRPAVVARCRNADFEEAIKKGMALFMDKALDKIAAGLAGWQGCAWILERRHKPQFSRTDQAVVAETEGGGLVLTDELAH